MTEFCSIFWCFIFSGFVISSTLTNQNQTDRILPEPKSKMSHAGGPSLYSLAFQPRLDENYRVKCGGSWENGIWRNLCLGWVEILYDRQNTRRQNLVDKVLELYTMEAYWFYVVLENFWQNIWISEQESSP